MGREIKRKKTGTTKKEEGKRKRARRPSKPRLPFSKRNYCFMAVGLILAILGFIFLALGDSVLSPIFLTLGYAVFIPIGLYLEPRS